MTTFVVSWSHFVEPEIPPLQTYDWLRKTLQKNIKKKMWKKILSFEPEVITKNVIHKERIL